MAHDLEINLEALFNAVRDGSELDLQKLTYLSQHQAEETVHLSIQNLVAGETSTSGSSSSDDGSDGSSPVLTYDSLEEVREAISVNDFSAVFQSLVNKIYNQTNFQNNFKLFEEAYGLRCIYSTTYLHVLM